MRTGFRRHRNALLFERSIDKDLPSFSLLSNIWSGEKIPLYALDICFYCFGLLDCMYYIWFSRLYSFREELRQDNSWTMCRLGRLLRMELNLQFDHRLPHPPSTITNGLACEYSYQTET